MAEATRYGCRGLAAEFDLGRGGPAVAADGTIVEVRAAYGGARTQLRAADPVGAYDAVTKGYTGTIAATAAACTNGVTAAAVITDHALVRGDGGARGIQGSGIIVDDSNNVSSMGTLGCGAITSSSTVQCTTLKATSLTDGYVPYRVSDASGLANSGLYYSSAGFGFGTTSFGASAVNVLSVGQGTAPGAATDIVGVWAADNNGTAGNTGLHIKPETGYIHSFYSSYTLKSKDYVYTTTGSQVIIGLGASTGNTYTQIAAYSSGGSVLNALKLRASGVLVTSDASVTTASAQLHSCATTEQLRLAYDATHYVPFTVGATGILTIAPNNAGAASYVSVTGRLGVGTASPSDTINAVAPASGGAASLGSEVLLNSTFDSDLSNWTAGDGNWTWGAGGTADHAAGATGTLTQTIATTSGQHYQFVITLSAYTAGTLTATLTSSTGSESFTLTSATTYTYSFKAGAASSTLTLTPTSTFVGSITSVSLKLITAASVYTIATMDSGSARSGLCSVTTDDALYNLFVGVGSGVLNTTGGQNSAMGYAALTANTTGSYNSAMGYFALAANTTGSYNSASGEGSGRYYGSGTSANQASTYSVYLGADTRAGADGNTNEIVIGYAAIGSGSNTATLGNTSVTQTVLRGNFGTITGAYGTSATNNVGIAAGTAPSAVYPADAAGFWVADRGGTADKAAIHIWCEDGTKHVFGDRVGICRIDPAYALDVTGNFRCSTGFGCNGATPQTAYASGGAAGAVSGTATSGGYGFADSAEFNAAITAINAIKDLANNHRSALVANGIES